MSMKKDLIRHTRSDSPTKTSIDHIADATDNLGITAELPKFIRAVTDQDGSTAQDPQSCWYAPQQNVTAAPSAFTSLSLYGQNEYSSTNSGNSSQVYLLQIRTDHQSSFRFPEAARTELQSHSSAAPAISAVSSSQYEYPDNYYVYCPPGNESGFQCQLTPQENFLFNQHITPDALATPATIYPAYLSPRDYNGNLDHGNYLDMVPSMEYQPVASAAFSDPAAISQPYSYLNSYPGLPTHGHSPLGNESGFQGQSNSQENFVFNQPDVLATPATIYPPYLSPRDYNGNLDHGNYLDGLQIPQMVPSMEYQPVASAAFSDPAAISQPYSYLNSYPGLPTHGYSPLGNESDLQSQLNTCMIPGMGRQAASSTALSSPAVPLQPRSYPSNHGLPTHDYYPPGNETNYQEPFSAGSSSSLHSGSSLDTNEGLNTESGDAFQQPAASNRPKANFPNILKIEAIRLVDFISVHPKGLIKDRLPDGLAKPFGASFGVERNSVYGIDSRKDELFALPDECLNKAKIPRNTPRRNPKVVKRNSSGKSMVIENFSALYPGQKIQFIHDELDQFKVFLVNFIMTAFKKVIETPTLRGNVCLKAGMAWSVSKYQRTQLYFCEHIGWFLAVETQNGEIVKCLVACLFLSSECGSDDYLFLVRDQRITPMLGLQEVTIDENSPLPYDATINIPLKRFNKKIGQNLQPERVLIVIREEAWRPISASPLPDLPWIRVMATPDWYHVPHPLGNVIKTIRKAEVQQNPIAWRLYQGHVEAIIASIRIQNPTFKEECLRFRDKQKIGS
ncbi:hypothetical protein BGX27_007493 [Mortierella sp. AM989]|nr:hypothetical protein BGX27_007493 [Mortierella sp. AM989]